MRRFNSCGKQRAASHADPDSLHTLRQPPRLSAFGGLLGYPPARMENVTVGLDIGGYEQRPDWPKMGPSLLIASCLILAIRTAKWNVRPADGTTADRDLDVEIEYAVQLAGRVFSALVGRHGNIFPQKREPWFVPNGDDEPR